LTFDLVSGLPASIFSSEESLTRRDDLLEVSTSSKASPCSLLDLDDAQSREWSHLRICWVIVVVIGAGIRGILWWLHLVCIDYILTTSHPPLVPGWGQLEQYARTTWGEGEWKITINPPNVSIRAECFTTCLQFLLQYKDKPATMCVADPVPVLITGQCLCSSLRSRAQ